MADEQVAVAPVVEAPIVEAPVVEQDLLSRVAAFKKSQPAVQPQNSGDEFFDYKEIEAIKDPVAKDIALRAYKSMQTGYVSKTQQLAEQRKEVEAKLSDIDNWTPERIQRELNNPKFLQAAQLVAGNQPNANPANSGLTNEEFSALTDREKAELSAIKNQNSVMASEINVLKQNNFQAVVAQKDLQLQQKFTDYNPVEIENSLRSLSNMNPVDIREYIYKATKFEDYGKACYELGKQEKGQLTQEKINAVSPNGVSSQASNNLPTRNSNESGASYFVRLAQARLAEARKK